MVWAVDPQDIFLPLCRWFEAGFREMGRDVKVRGNLDRRGKKWLEGVGLREGEEHMVDSRI
jgi:hypothetical protein